MRLTCPNCGAVYEVPDEVIPDNGRDVQCSNCGDTWFQTHPSNPDASPMGAMAELPPEDEGDWEEEPETSWPEPEPEVEEDEQPARRPLSEEVSNVLREEAEREQQARTQDMEGGIETQPDLGLSDPDEAERRSQEAKARMARLRGLDADADDPSADIDMGSRRNLLPDIEDIDQRIKTEANHSQEDVSARDGSRVATQKDGPGGFARGMRLAILLAIIATAVYMLSPQLSAAVPAVAEPLDSFVQVVDGLRAALQEQVGGLLPLIPGLGG